MSEFTGVISSQRTQVTSKVAFLITFSLWWVLLIFFRNIPAIDLNVAQYFFSERACNVLDGIDRICGVFAYDRNPIFSEIRSILFVLPYAAMVVLIASIVHSRLTGGRGWKSRRIEVSFAALISLAIGCGLIVNMFLKAFSGRPRPRETALFGGSLDFVQAGSFAGKCLKNCSFVSGEASSAGWLLCLMILLPRQWRLQVGIPLALVSITVPVLRVVTGAHYISDAILGWLSSIVIFVGVLTVIEAMTGRRYLSDDE